MDNREMKSLVRSVNEETSLRESRRAKDNPYYTPSPHSPVRRSSGEDEGRRRLLKWMAIGGAGYLAYRLLQKVGLGDLVHEVSLTSDQKWLETKWATYQSLPQYQRRKDRLPADLKGIIVENLVVVEPETKLRKIAAADDLEQGQLDAGTSIPVAFRKMGRDPLGGSNQSPWYGFEWDGKPVFAWSGNFRIEKPQSASGQ